jgi:hypothetical protein
LNQTKKLFITSELYKTIKQFTFEKKGIDPNRRQYNYYYIIHKIICGKTFHKGAYKGVKINSAALSTLFGKSKQDTCSIIKDLVTWGCIKLSQKPINYNNEKRSARYDIAEKYSSEKILVLLVSISDVGFIRKLIKEETLNSFDVLDALSSNCKLLSINDHGLDYIRTKYSLHDNASNFDQGGKRCVGEFDMADLPLFLIYLEDFNTSRPDEMSRVYNNLTNLKREHRQFVNFNGKALLMTDISNCQVLLSVVAVRKQFSIMSGRGLSGLPKDIVLYQELAETGEFYEYLIEKSSYTGERSQFKKDFFSQVFFSKPANFSMRIKDNFVREFPNVYKLITQLKVKNYKDFAIGLQRLEAKIIIDNVAKGMIKKGKAILTLHDAVVTDCTESLNMAEEMISKAMSKYNITPKFKREIGKS